MRIILDVVMNHAGYATLADLQDLGLTDLTQNTGKLPSRWNEWRPSGGLNWHGYNQFIDYQSSHWDKWWGLTGCGPACPATRNPAPTTSPARWRD
jgi:alpha-amylase